MKNLIPEILSDTEYEVLTRKGILNKKAVRDFAIRRDCEAMNGQPRKVIIDTLCKQYPELKRVSIRKILYKK